MIKVSALTGVLLLALASVALAKPATTLKITESTKIESIQDSPWLIRTMLSTDLGVAGAQGGGFSIGHMGEYIFVDFGASFWRATYEAVHVHQTGFGPTSTASATTEVTRARTPGDTGSMFTLGGGIGFLFKLLGSENWVESGRFGLNYMQYQDSTNSLTFRGPMFNFHAEAGYRLSRRIMIAPGVTYNVGLVARSGEGKGTVTSDLPSAKFLPISWWAWEFAFSFFL